MNNREFRLNIFAAAKEPATSTWISDISLHMTRHMHEQFASNFDVLLRNIDEFREQYRIKKVVSQICQIHHAKFILIGKEAKPYCFHNPERNLKLTLMTLVSNSLDFTLGDNATIREKKYYMDQAARLIEVSHTENGAIIYILRYAVDKNYVSKLA